MKRIVSMLISATALAAAPASATDLVANGAFVSGNFWNWSVDGDVFMASLANFDANYSASSSFVALLNAGNSEPNGMLEQIVSTTRATTYDLSFAYGVTAGGNQSIVASILDAASLDVLATRTVTASLGGLENFTMSFVAQSNASIIRFNDLASNDTFNQDGAVGNVSVSAAVPEPATWAMMLMGMGAVGYSVRRQKQRPRIRFA